MISKPDANPILFAVCNLFLWGCVGYFLMGQTKKAIFSVVYTMLTCGMFSWLAAFDAYTLGQKLQSGEEIGESEVGLGFLGMLPGFG
jgi:hypothetical protein